MRAIVGGSDGPLIEAAIVGFSGGLGTSISWTRLTEELRASGTLKHDEMIKGARVTDSGLQLYIRKTS